MIQINDPAAFHLRAGLRIVHRWQIHGPMHVLVRDLRQYASPRTEALLQFASSAKTVKRNNRADEEKIVKMSLVVLVYCPSSEFLGQGAA
jgi:hypothetical protein